VYTTTEIMCLKFSDSQPKVALNIWGWWNCVICCETFGGRSTLKTKLGRNRVKVYTVRIVFALYWVTHVSAKLTRGGDGLKPSQFISGFAVW
jgi:hypothetical protein